MCSLGLEDKISLIVASSSVAELEALRVSILGKGGVLTSALRGLASISDPEKKRSAGAELNLVRSAIEDAIRIKVVELKLKELESSLMGDCVDITIPVREWHIGSIHLISRTIQELVRIFSPMGFSYRSGPEIEDQFHVFDALNTPELHPARNMNDTFYLNSGSNGMLLRTHTSSVQIRVMSHESPPLMVLSAGRVYRNDWDATHTPMFHQLELLCIDSKVDIGHLKFCIASFLRAFFGNDVIFRFRSSFFPFTEPSLEVDIEINGQWIEILGCGMVHSNVLRNIGIDSSVHSGFAAGIGIERLIMLKYGLDDIRMLYGPDVDFLNFHGKLFS